MVSLVTVLLIFDSFGLVLGVTIGFSLGTFTLGVICSLKKSICFLNHNFAFSVVASFRLFSASESIVLYCSFVGLDTFFSTICFSTGLLGTFTGVLVVVTGFFITGFTLGVHSIELTGLLVRGLAFLKLLIADLTFSIGIPIVFAISHIRRGLASASPVQNAGVASCPNTIQPPVITPASHFASIGLRLAPAICHCIFLPVYCSISFTIS
jgi:hypothetical protein